MGARKGDGKGAAAAGKGAGKAGGAAGTRPRRRRPAAAAVARKRAGAVPAARHEVKATRSAVEHFKREAMQYLDGNGYVSWSQRERKYVILGTNAPKGGLVACPECGIGQLMVIRSRASGKRFIGCSNFYGGCEASSPLLQKARLRATKAPCGICGWPIIIFRYSRNQKWTRQCANIGCKSRNVRPPGQDTRRSSCS